jgi:hypothetical protein
MARHATGARKGRRTETDGRGNGAHRLFDDILALAGTLARGRQDYGADKLMSLAASTREFAASMTDMPNLRAQAASAAESIEGLAEYVMHTDIEQMIKDAGTFARRHPAATLAITAAAGVAASRWMTPAARRGATVSRRSTAAPRVRKQSARPRRRANGQAHASA